MKRYKTLTIAVALGLAAVAEVTAASIGVNFVGRNSNVTPLQPGESAGVVAQANWNNVAGDPYSGTSAPLADNTKAFTAVKLVYQASDSWVSDGPTVTADDRLMKGIQKANPDPDLTPANGSDKVTLTLTNLSAGTYDVLVYCTANGATAKIGVKVGATTYYFEEQYSFDGTFVQASSTNPNDYELGPNYARFNGVAAAADGTITILATKLLEDPQVNDGIGIAAVQVIKSSSFPPNTTAPGMADATLPADTLVAVGSSAKFTVVPDGPWGVQWQKNGVDIPGATGTTYTAPNVTMADSGAKYRAIVNNNVGPAVTSREATLTVGNPVLSPGFLTINYYENEPGTTIAALLANASFIAKEPTSVGFIPAFDTPNGHGDNYGAEVTGWIVPTVTANYYFYIRSDDSSALYLNETGEAIPDPRTGDLVPICEETGCCNPFMAVGSTQTSAQAYRLEAGKKYGVCALLNEGGGGDYLQVAWSTDVEPLPDPTSLRPIPGTYLATTALAEGRSITITTQPADLTQQEVRTAKFTVAYTIAPGDGPIGFQWQKNGVDIVGANAISYTTPALSMADNGGKYRVLLKTLAGVSTTSTEATLTVVPDTFPPALVGAGALASQTGTTYDVGVTFDEPLDSASVANAANYKLSSGSISKVTSYPGSPGVALTASGLTVGNTYTVTVTGVKDLKSNTMPATSKDFKVSGMKWGAVGANELGMNNAIVAVSENSWDVYSDGIGEWGTYDEATFVYEQVTGDFDKVLRVEYQDSSSQWARAGLIARDVTNFGVNRDSQDAGEAGRYQKVHVNPVVTAMGTAGNNSWEGNQRLATGAATTTAGGGGTPLYPHVWCRLQRVGQTFTIFRSDDGVTWTQLGTSTFDPAMPDTLYVGPEYSPENGNLAEDSGLRGVWLAKFRDYGNFSVAVTPTISVNSATGVITYTGTLVSSTTVKGTYAPVAGATSPYTVPKTGTAMFYQTSQ